MCEIYPQDKTTSHNWFVMSQSPRQCILLPWCTGLFYVLVDITSAKVKKCIMMSNLIPLSYLKNIWFWLWLVSYLTTPKMAMHYPTFYMLLWLETNFIMCVIDGKTRWSNSVADAMISCDKFTLHFGKFWHCTIQGCSTLLIKIQDVLKCFIEDTSCAQVNKSNPYGSWDMGSQFHSVLAVATRQWTINAQWKSSARIFALSPNNHRKQ